MKIKRIFLTSLAAFSLVGVASCDLFPQQSGSDTSIISSNTNTTSEENINNETSENIYKIYTLAKQSGFTGTYEEWLESIKGDSVELRVDSGKFEWKYKNSTEWITLITIQELVGNKPREVELSATSDYLVWRYVGDTEWKNLIQIPLISRGKSAYEVAVEVGFTGTKEEWVASLNGRGIKKIEKTNTVENVDTYTVTFTDDTTFEFTVTNAKIEEEQNIDEYKGLSFKEIIGYGYALTGVYNVGKTLVIPREYKGKPVIKIDRNAIYDASIETIVIPNTIQKIESNSINAYNIRKLVYDGTLDNFEKIVDGINSIYTNSFMNYYFADENGNEDFNGKKYSSLSNLTITSIDDIQKYSKYSKFITELTLTKGIIGDNSISLSNFYNVKDIFFNGTNDDWFDIKFNDFINQNNSNAISLYFEDDNGKTINNGKKYSLVKDLNVPSGIDSNLKYYITGYSTINSITINSLDCLENNISILNNLNLNYVFYDGDYEQFVSSYIDNINFNLYVKYENGTFVYNSKKYISNKDIVRPSTDLYYTGSGNTHIVWDPISAATAKASYEIDKTKDLDIWLVYSRNYGTTNNLGKVITNPITNKTYAVGDLLPAWESFRDNLGVKEINQMGTYGVKNDSENFTNFKNAWSSTDNAYVENGKIADLFYNTTAGLNQLGDEDKLVDLTSYIDGGKMPALKKFLDDNPGVRAEITHGGKIYYSPYMDGFQAIERNFMMDTTLVEKLLDEALPEGTGYLVAGAAAPIDSKGLKGAPQAKSFLGTDGKNYDADLKIKIVVDNEAKEVTVKQTDNILKQQNELLAKTDGSCTGKALIDQFKAYAQAAYGDIITQYYDGKISKMFTSVGACYNADDLVALLRIFKACPDVLYESGTAYDEVVPVFPRAQSNNRIENILNFACTLYGVQGKGSEYNHLFFGADGKIHDFETATASYDMLDKMHDLYAEGLIQQNFWAGSNARDGLERFFQHVKGDGKSTFGLMEYDYIATQSVANDKVGGIGTDPTTRQTAACGFNFANLTQKGVKPILSPLTYVSTESYKWDQSLDDNTGKTITRYYEENRSVKNTSWSIPKSSDNIDSAVAMIDYMFTKEGWQIQNIGPTGHWTEETILGETAPKLVQKVLDDYQESGQDFWNYCRGYLGTTQGIGHYRPTTLDYQATNEYSRQGYADLIKACDLGVQMTSRAVDIKQTTWHSSMPMSAFPTIDHITFNQYAGVTNFWSQVGKATKDGTEIGWVAIVAEGSAYSGNVLNNINGMDYNYQQVKNEIQTKNLTYLYMMGNTYNLVAPEANKD